MTIFRPPSKGEIAFWFVPGAEELFCLSSALTSIFFFKISRKKTKKIFFYAHKKSKNLPDLNFFLIFFRLNLENYPPKTRYTLEFKRCAIHLFEIIHEYWIKNMPFSCPQRLFGLWPPRTSRSGTFFQTTNFSVLNLFPEIYLKPDFDFFCENFLFGWI